MFCILTTKSLRFTLLISLFPLLCDAQGLTNIGVRIQPKLKKIYDAGILESEIKEEGTPSNRYQLNGDFMPPSDNAIWRVYAAYNNVPVYQGPSESSGKMGETLNIFSEYMVYSRHSSKGGSNLYADAWFRIIEYDQFGINVKLQTTKPLKIVGYVKATDLLIWDEALRDDANQYVKMLAVHDVNSLQDVVNKARQVSQNLQVFDSPELDVPRKEISVPMLDFLFIYKSKLNSKGQRVYLLGKNENLNNGAELVLLGWAGEELLKRWPGRLVLEPNREKEAVRERAGNYNFRIAMEKDGYSNASRCMDFSDPGERGWDPARKRIPVFKDRTSPSEYGVSFITNGEQSSDNVSKEDMEKREAYARIVDNVKKVNLVLVIDGSEVTSNYRNEVTSVFRKIGTMNKNFQYRFGYVVYRDKVNPSEVMELTNNNNRFTESLESISYSNQGDNNPSEQSLMDAIREAGKLFDGKSNESNFILVMGSGGDMRTLNQPQLTTDAVNVLVRNKIHVLANQFFCRSEAGYSVFQRQIREMCQKSCAAINEELASQNKSVRDFNPKFAKTKKNTFAINYPSSSPRYAQIYVAVEGEQFSPEEFQYSIENSFNTIENELTRILSDAQNWLENNGSKGGASSGLCLLLRDAGLPCDFLSKNNLAIMVEGYLKEKDNSLTYPVYSKSLFLTGQELSEIRQFFEAVVSKSGTIEEMRESTYQAIFNMVTSFKGNKENNNKQAKRVMAEMSMSDFWTQITGVPPKCDLLRKIRFLRDIKNVQAVSDNDVNDFSKMVRSALPRLAPEVIQRYRFNQAGMDYYWLPISVLPCQ